MNFVELNGITLHYKMINADSGKPVIVFSNSLGTDFRIWDDCVADLSADFAILLVGANMGVLKMTKEHLGIINALKIPFCVVFSKIDICPEPVLERNKREITTERKT